MPLTAKGEEIMAAMVKEYGEEKAKEVFYASKNAGKITGVDEETMSDNIKQHFYITSRLSDHIAETPEGYLLATDVPVTRIGEFLYKGNELMGEDGRSLVEASADGVVRIQRDESEVFSPTAIASLLGKSLTMDHPDGFVGPENWQGLTHGIVQNVRRGENGQGDMLIADILVTTEEAIKAIKSGQREVSLGYDANYEDLGGGQGRQKDLIFNHCALVSKGRAGSRCAIQDRACTGCGECICSKNKLTKDSKEEEVPMTLKEKMMKWFDSCPVKDEDVEEKLTPEQEAEKKKIEEEKTAEAKDKRFKDQEEKVGDLEGRLKRIEDMLAELLSEDDGETEDADPLPKQIKDQELDEEEKKKLEEEAAKKKEAEDAAVEEEKKAEEEKEEEEKKTTDAAWPELISRADILVPGIRLSKPTKDHLKGLDEIKIDILKKAVSGGDKEVLTPLLGNKKFRVMTTDALDIAFVAASELVATNRNKKIQVADGTKLKVHDFAEARTVADINKANKDFYGEKIFVEKS